MANRLPADTRWALVKHKANEARAAKAAEILRGAKIDSILIKGVAAAANYPPDEFRDAVDTDLAVSEKDLDEAVELLRQANAIGLAVDLHRELRHLDPLPWDDLLQNSRKVPVEGGEIRVLRPEDHLRVLCVHWLTDGGSNLDRLADIRYAIENRPVDFDWVRALDVVPKKRRRWIIFAIAIAAKEFDIDLSQTPLASELARPFPAWVERAVRLEWADPVKFRPLGTSTDSWSSFFGQMRKRFPPNPITATILTQGSLDARTPLVSQIKTIFSRIGPSLRSVGQDLLFKLK